MRWLTIRLLSLFLFLSLAAVTVVFHFQKYTSKESTITDGPQYTQTKLLFPNGHTNELSFNFESNIEGIRGRRTKRAAPKATPKKTPTQKPIGPKKVTTKRVVNLKTTPRPRVANGRFAKKSTATIPKAPTKVKPTTQRPRGVTGRFTKKIVGKKVPQNKVSAFSSKPIKKVVATGAGNGRLRGSDGRFARKAPTPRALTVTKKQPGMRSSSKPAPVSKRNVPKKQIHRPTVMKPNQKAAPKPTSSRHTFKTKTTPKPTGSIQNSNQKTTQRPRVTAGKLVNRNLNQKSLRPSTRNPLQKTTPSSTNSKLPLKSTAKPSSSGTKLGPNSNTTPKSKEIREVGKKNLVNPKRFPTKSYAKTKSEKAEGTEKLIQVEQKSPPSKKVILKSPARQSLSYSKSKTLPAGNSNENKENKDTTNESEHSNVEKNSKQTPSKESEKKDSKNKEVDDKKVPLNDKNLKSGKTKASKNSDPKEDVETNEIPRCKRDADNVCIVPSAKAPRQIRKTAKEAVDIVAAKVRKDKEEEDEEKRIAAARFSGKVFPPARTSYVVPENANKERPIPKGKRKTAKIEAKDGSGKAIEVEYHQTKVTIEGQSYSKMEKLEATLVNIGGHPTDPVDDVKTNIGTGQGLPNHGFQAGHIIPARLFGTNKQDWNFFPVNPQLNRKFSTDVEAPLAEYLKKEENKNKSLKVGYHFDYPAGKGTNVPQGFWFSVNPEPNPDKPISGYYANPGPTEDTPGAA